MDKEQVLFSLADDPESRLVFDAPKLKAQTTIGDSPVELSRDMSNKKTEAKISRDFGPFELTGKVGRQNKENTALLRAASDRAFIEASRDPYNRALSAGYSDGKFNANFQRSLPNDGGRPSNSLNLGYKTTFADGGPAQQVTQFQPTFSQQGLGSIEQEPYTPPMESTPQDYYSQYAPTQQYNAPAANPMTAGLGSYMEGLQYKAPPPPAAPPPAAPAARNYSWNSGKYADEAALRSALGTYATQNNYTPASVDTWMGDQATYGISSTPAAAPSTTTAYNPQTQQYTAPTAPVEPAVPAQTAQEIAYQKFKAEQDERDYMASTQGGSAAGGRIHAYAQGGSIPQGIASLGRGQDSMLVHMTPGEVQGLQRLAMAHGGSLTINPQTGLPEAGFLSSLLPMIAGAGLMLIPGMQPLGAAAITGGIGALATGSLSKGLMYGLGAYGGAGLGESLAGMGAGAEATAAAAGSELTGALDPRLGELGINTAYTPPVPQAPPELGSITGADALATAAGNPVTQVPIAAESVPPSTTPVVQNVQQTPQAVGADPGIGTKQVVQNPVNATWEGFKQATSSPGAAGDFLKKNYKSVAMAAAPVLSSALTPNKFAPPARTPTQYSRYGDSTTPGYTPPRYNPLTGNYDPASYGPGSYYTNPTQYAAKGGAVGFKQGGIADFYPLTGDRPNTGGLGGAAEKPRNSRKINDPDSGAGIYDDKAGEGPYSDSGGIYENTPSDVASLFDKASAATLARYIADGKSAHRIAAAKKEFYERANAYNKNYGDTTSAAQGGLMGLNTYAAGGKLLRGPGDGMSDSIPAVIQGAKPQRAALADGEFVIPADVVSHLGNGSTEAGSRQLYAMMNKIRKARTGNPKQGKQINPARFMPA